MATLPQTISGASVQLQHPVLPTSDFWTETQWTVFMSLLEAVLPSISRPATLSDKANQVRVSEADYAAALKLVQNTMKNPPSEEKFQEYLAHNPAKEPSFRDCVTRTMAALPSAAQRQLGAAMAGLATRTGTLFLTGYWTPVHQQPLYVRERILKGWQTSRLPNIRVLSKSLCLLAQKCAVQTSPLFRELTDYTDMPEAQKQGEGFDFNFMQFDPSASPAVIETDVVIVGSGCGGAVAAKVLAEAGHKVLVVDKSYYYPPSQLPMSQDMGCQYLYENGGFITSDDNSLNLVAGSCWGGGGTVNWSVSLQTQGFVRKEWSEQRGLPFFTSPQFQNCLDKVCDFMGVSADGVRHNHRNQVLLDGSRKLGWHAVTAPQNTGGAEHYCGRCHLGCGSAEKQGPAVSWLPAAAASGAKFIEGFEVEKVTFDESTGSKRATGVVGKWVSRDANGSVSGPVDERSTREIIVKAKKVIIAAGSVCSPLVLLRSGLTNRHIGQNLHVHPCNFVGGYWKEDVKPWEGGIITSYCSTFEDLDKAGHGVKLEPTCMIPYAILASMPWHGGLEAKLAELRFRHFGAFISLTRDRDTGRVYPDPITGRPRIHYVTSDFDRANTLEGVIALAKICYVEGASEIHAFFPGLEPFVREDRAEPPENTGLPSGIRSNGDDEGMLDGINDPSFVAWLAKVRQVGNAPPVGIFSSAHQMGTCRMAPNEDEGVVGPKGHVWGTEGLFIADASVFPSASGVNPMITNMAIADWIAGGVSKEIKAEHA
ncbi:Long-chain-alcohol oxidase FAO2-like protein 2 [Colletotrichum chlorophyti]|uniref:Long-chain-alcohol oxidase n=1 Tax=Colletotrichum chlorophyti TaxID=708187 RepID=A0A1Q8RBP2_9PEZI|nr:Long-chain-alcohol oxidase FAO2-like protein 2 [Colletotrichum chlorophyti]